MSTEAVYCFTPRDTFPSKKKYILEGVGEGKFPLSPSPSLFFHFFRFARSNFRDISIGNACNVGYQAWEANMCDPFIQNSDRSDREKWSTSKGGPVFSKLFRLGRTDPLSFGPKFPEILVESPRPLSANIHR